MDETELSQIKDMQKIIMLNIQKLGKGINNISESVLALRNFAKKGREAIEMKAREGTDSLLNRLKPIKDSISQLDQKMEQSIQMYALKSHGKGLTICCELILLITKESLTVTLILNRLLQFRNR